MRKTRPVDWAHVPLVVDMDYAASIVGYTPETLIKHAKKGKLRATKPGGGGWRIEKDALREYISGRKEPSQCNIAQPSA